MPTRPPTHRPSVQTRAATDQARGQLPYRKLLWTQRFRRFRLWLLAQRPLCECCQAEKRLTPAKDIHHRRGLADHPEDLCDQDQCEALCHACHSRATLRGE